MPGCAWPAAWCMLLDAVAWRVSGSVKFMYLIGIKTAFQVSRGSSFGLRDSLLMLAALQQRIGVCLQDEQDSSDSGDIALLSKRAAAEGLRMVPERFRPCQEAWRRWCISSVPGNI